jgi:hypothetical protein
MGLTADEQRELNQLEGEVGHVSQGARPGLSADEHDELASLEKEVGHAVPKASASKTENEPGILDTVLHGVAAAGKFIDSYAGAPTRAAIGAYQHGKPMGAAFANQFGEDPATAPTGHQIAVDAGVSDKAAPALSAEQLQKFDEQNNPGWAAQMKSSGQKYENQPNPSPAAVAGLGIDLAADPVNLIPMVGAAKKFVRGAEVAEEAAKAPGILEKVGQGLNSYAEKSALKGAGATLKDFRKAYSSGAVNETGRFILDNGLLKAGDTYESVAAKAKDLRNATGKELGAGYESAEKAISSMDDATKAKVAESGFNPVRDKQAILDAAKKDLGYSYKRKSALQGVSDFLDELIEEHGDKTLNPAQTNEIKTALDQSAINYERNPLLKEPDAETALKSFRGFLSDKVGSQIKTVGEAIGDPAAAENLSALNKRYGMSSNVARIASDRSMRDAANAAFGLKEYAGAEIGGKIGEAVAGKPGEAVGTIVGIGGGKVLRKIGPSTIASGADTAGDVLKGAPKIDGLGAPLASVSKLADTDAAALSKAADQPAPSPATKKGPSAWASNGFQKLIEHAQGGDKEAVQQAREQLMSSRAGMRLLISASDLKPGSKAMQRILEQVKAEASK